MPSVSGNVGAVASVSSVFGRNGGVVAANGDYSGVVAAHLTGATAATRYVGGTASGAPVAGTFAVGDFVIEQTGKVYVCTVAGTPGTWVAPGGESPLIATLTLNNAQILALPSTPLTLAATPGPGHGLVPIFAVVALNISGAVTGITADTNYPFIWIASSTSHFQSLLPVAQDDPDSGNALTDMFSVVPAKLVYVYPAPGLTTLGGLHAVSTVDVAGEVEDRPLQIGATNSPGGDFTGGDPANAMKVTVAYLDVALA